MTISTNSIAPALTMKMARSGWNISDALHLDAVAPNADDVFVVVLQGPSGKGDVTLPNGTKGAIHQAIVTHFGKDVALYLSDDAAKKLDAIKRAPDGFQTFAKVTARSLGYDQIGRKSRHCLVVDGADDVSAM